MKDTPRMFQHRKIRGASFSESFRFGKINFDVIPHYDTVRLFICFLKNKVVGKLTIKHMYFSIFKNLFTNHLVIYYSHTLPSLKQI